MLESPKLPPFPVWDKTRHSPATMSDPRQLEWADTRSNSGFLEDMCRRCWSYNPILRPEISLLSAELNAFVGLIGTVRGQNNVNPSEQNGSSPGPRAADADASSSTRERSEQTDVSQKPHDKATLNSKPQPEEKIVVVEGMRVDLRQLFTEVWRLGGVANVSIS